MGSIRTRECAPSKDKIWGDPPWGEIDDFRGGSHRDPAPGRGSVFATRSEFRPLPLLTSQEMYGWRRRRGAFSSRWPAPCGFGHCRSRRSCALRLCAPPASARWRWRRGGAGFQCVRQLKVELDFGDDAIGGGAEEFAEEKGI